MCKKRRLAQGYASCSECREKSRQRMANRDSGSFNAQRREEYQKRRADGICVICGSQRASPGRVRCEVCARIGNARKKAAYAEAREPLR